MRQFFLLFASTILACACGGPSDAGLFHSDSTNSTPCVDGATVACTDTTGCQGQQLCSDGQLGACTCGTTNSGGAGGTPLGSGGSSAGGLPGTGGQLGTGGFDTGGFGGSGAGGSAGDAGVVPSTGGIPDAGQQAPDSGSSGCAVGSYVGTLSGPYGGGITGTTTFMADLTFTVDASGNVSGKLTGTSDKTSSATLFGIMNCSTDAVMISVEKGTYGTLPLGAGQYSGSMSGSYDPSSHAFVNGTWKFTEPNSTRGGQGNWTAQAGGMLPP